MRGYGPSAWRLGLKSLVLGALVLTGLLSCTQTETTGKGDELQRANYLIDRRQYSEAIYILSERLSREPGELRARILLASAYSGRAGLSMASFSVFAREIDKWKLVDDILPPDGNETWLDQVTRVSFRLQVALRAFDALPAFEHPEALKDLAQAAQILDGGGRLAGGASIFRAMVHVVNFKTDVRGRLKPQVTAVCRIAPTDLNNWLSQISAEVSKIITDVAYGFADEGARERTLKLEKDLSASVESLGRARDLLPPVPPKAGTPLLPSTVEWPFLLKKVYGACGG